MDGTQSKLQLLHQKISEGMNLTFKKLVAQKRKNNGYLVFSDQGKIIKVQAKDIEI
ncbi:hypothetical protein [Pedobacter mucosus]|uniref:hypothetical protein n=1 Tax=Pedobacter mucosus TaxID=2895286 RepID=UPI001EE4E105|nr:hypothetical protein [Pedobacter mucosus]UKT64869.1 hypothetical protein LOK61_03640 [Pedobacter mucosus]